MSNETKGDEKKREAKAKSPKLPRGVRQRPDGRFRLYVTRFGKPFQPLVTWELLTELGVNVPETTRLSHPGLELANKALIKLQAHSG